MPLFDNFWSLSPRERDLPVSVNLLKTKPVQEQYAILRTILEHCGTEQDDRYKRAYDAGFRDYELFWYIEGIVAISINWSKCAILFGTECIDVMDTNNQLHEIGEMIVTLFPIDKTITVENSTRRIRNNMGNDFPHPHVSPNNHLCISDGHQQIQCAMTDHNYPKVMQIIMRALYMRSNETKLGTAFCGLHLWPLKSEVSKK